MYKRQVVWEGVGWIALLLIAFNEKGVHNSSVLNFNEAKVLSIILFVVIYVAIQVNLLRLNLSLIHIYLSDPVNKCLKQ